MDHGTKERVRKEPTGIRDDMRETRVSLTKKLETLEGHITKKTEDIQHRVEETVDKVKGSVDHTVQTIKDTIDWRHQMNEHPWAMFGGAVLAGYLVGRFIGSGESRSVMVKSLAAPTKVPGLSDSRRLAGTETGPNLLDKAKDQFKAQRDRLEHTAISAASNLIEGFMARALPDLARYLH